MCLCVCMCGLFKLSIKKHQNSVGINDFNEEIFV